MNRGLCLSAATFFTILITSLAVISTTPTTARAAELEAEFVAVDDTTTSEESPDATLGDSDSIHLSASPARSGLVRFDVSGIPDGARITSATLSLRATADGESTGAVHLVEGAWDEDTTWSSAPELGERLAASSAADHDGGRAHLDVSAGVSGNGTVAFYLLVVEGADIIVASSESGDGPRLHVTWTEGIEPDVVEDPLIEPDIDPVPDSDVDPDAFELMNPDATLPPDIGAFSALAAASGSSATLAATADASIDSGARTTNRGNNTRLDVDGSPQMRTLLRFDASDIPSSAEITSARLRLYTVDSSGNAGSVNRVSGSWSEGSVTWANAPDVGSRVSNIGAVRSGSWATVDVTSAIGSGDTVNLYLVSSAPNGAEFSSSESRNAPRLIIEWGGGGSGGTSPTPTPTPSPIVAPRVNNSGCQDIPSSRLGLLNEREGFGRDVSGGAGGCLYTVTNDNNDGPGSLRWAAERGGYWIVFAGNYNIRLDGELDVAGNTTIDGRGSRVTIERHGLYILRPDSSNVILANLTIQGSRDGEDLVEVRKGATRFWLHHLTLRDSSDEFIDIGSPSSNGITGTVSWTRFEGTNGNEIVFIIGDKNNEQYNSRIRVTAHHNYYAGTNARHPLISGAKLHSYNNVYQWIRWGIQVRAADDPSEVVSERDIFDARVARQPKQGIYFQGGTNHVRVTGALYLNGGGIQNPNNYGNPSRAFDPPYGYDAETANQSLFNRVTSGAGNR